MVDLNREAQEDRAKARFFGPLGGFIVSTADEARNDAPCASTAFRTSNFASSELDLPRQNEQAVCLDGTAIAVCSHSIGCRQYYLGSPKVPVEAPRERLEALTVEGRPALAVEPVPSFSGWVLYVIERPPADGKPGILLQVLGKPGDGLAGALDLVGELLPE